MDTTDTKDKPRSGKSAAYQNMDIGLQLNAPGFAPSSSAPISLDPVVATPMEVSIDQLQPYSLNPRTTKNPKYDEIKECIRNRGLDHIPPISRRPGETLFTIVNGGNTRLAILKELYAETKNPDYFRIPCLYKPWKGDISALIGHLVENEQRAEMSFIEKAVAIRQTQGLLEQESGEKYSQRKLAEALKQQGIELNQSHISRMFHCLDYLLPVIPTLLYGGLGKPQIEKAIQLRNTGWSLVEQSDKRLSEDYFTARFNAALAELEEEGQWDFESLKSNFATQLGVLLGRPYSHVLMELDTLLNDRSQVIPQSVPPVITPVAAASQKHSPAKTAPSVPPTPVEVEPEPVIDSNESTPTTTAFGQSVDMVRTDADSPLGAALLPDGSQVLLPNEVVRWGLEVSMESKTLAQTEGQSLQAALHAAAEKNPWRSRFNFCLSHLANAFADARRYFLYRTPNAPGSHGLELDLAHSRVWFQMACEGFLRQMQIDTKLVHYWPLATGLHLYVPETDDDIARFQQRFPAAYAPFYFLLWDFAGYNSHEMLSAIIGSELHDKLPALSALVEQGIDEPNAMREHLRARLYPELVPGGNESHLMMLYAEMTDEQRSYFMMMLEGHRNLQSRWTWSELLEPEPLPDSLHP